MARALRSSILESKEQRLRLEAGLDHPVRLSSGKYIGYTRAPKKGGAGSWFASWRDGETRARARIQMGTADDYENADGINILTFRQAQEKAIIWFEQQQQLLIAKENGEIIPQGPFSVADALDAYFKEREMQGMKSLEDARKRANIWIIPTLGNVEVAKLTHKQVLDWFNYVGTSPKRVRTKAGGQPTYASAPTTEKEKKARKANANRLLNILRPALNYVYEKNMVKVTDPCWQRVKTYRGVAGSRDRFLTVEEQVRLVNVCPPDFRDLVRGALLTGCRFGELARLQCKDFNPNTQRPTIFIAISKSGKPRHIFLTREGVDFFNELTARKQGPNDLMFTHSVVDKKEQARDTKGKFDNSSQKLLITSWRKGQHLRLMQQVCRAAGIEYLCFHELRHTYASTAINAGMPLPVIAQQLGHSDTRMVEKHYGHLAQSYVADMVNATMPILGILDEPKFQKLKLSGA